MLIQRNSALLRLIAVVLLFCLTFTGCMSELPETASGNNSCPTPDEPLAVQSEQPQTEATTVHEHTFGDATCISPKTCSACGEAEGEPLGHRWKDATCTEPATCSVCGATDGKATGHTWKKATCTTPVTCDSCGQTDGEPMGHNWKTATCITASTCEYCGQTKGTTVDHDWQEATCTTAATCIVCGKTKGSPSEHKWKSATCTTPKTCKICGKTKGSAAAHQYSKGKCKVCGEKDLSYGESSSGSVWIPTNGGKKYHSHSGCSNMKNPKKVSLSKAKQLGFTACKKCYG